MLVMFKKYIMKIYVWKSFNKKLRLDINNGITLSRETHQEFHRKFGIKNNNLDQLLQFLEK